MKDYDYDIKYQPGKTNMVADAFNKKVFISQLMVKREIQKNLATRTDTRKGIVLYTFRV